MKFRKTFNEAAMARRAQKRNLLYNALTRGSLVLALIASQVGLFVINHQRKVDRELERNLLRSIQSQQTSAKRDELPATLNINGEQWNIVLTSGFTDKKGNLLTQYSAMTFCKEKMIAYLQDSDKGNFRNTLWHEIFHAGACKYGGDQHWNSLHPTMDKHQGVYNLGMFMGDFSAANPGFMEWSAR